MIIQITQENCDKLYEYFTNNINSAPYYFQTSFEDWRACMFADTTYKGAPLFSELLTFAIIDNEQIEGFISFGYSAFVFSDDDTLDFAKKYAIIRHVHYLENAKNVDMLFEKANEYFDTHKVEERYAFFHYFGMSCYARQGKLHETAFYIEDTLTKHGFELEHENVYFAKEINEESNKTNGINIVTHERENGLLIDFVMDVEQIGGCELYFVKNSTICYLKWIYVDTSQTGAGLGTMCMQNLFAYLHETGITRIDTDAPDINTIAQGFYAKNGFVNKGKMRSYYKV